MFKVFVVSLLYVVIFYIFMLIRGTVPRYKITILVCFFWRFIVFYSLLFLLITIILVSLF